MENYKWWILRDDRIDGFGAWTAVMGVQGGVIVRYSYNKADCAVATTSVFIPGETIENFKNA